MSTSHLVYPTLVAVLLSMSIPMSAADAVPDPVHAAHVAAAADNQALAAQIAELRAKLQQVESSIPRPTGQPNPNMATPGMSAMPAAGGGMNPPAGPMAGGAAPGMNAMPPMGGGAKTMQGGMSAMPSPPAGGMNMMVMMDKMMGMMDKMMSMDGGMPAGGAPMASAQAGGMGKMPGGMGGGAMPPAAPPAGMRGGMGMDKDKMGMAGMMGMGAMSNDPGSMPQSMLPGFPGASHLYHIGATDFFLDHSEHIALTTEQTAALNKAKEQALLAKNTAERAGQQAEQELWSLTASDQPDAAKTEGKIREIAKIAGDERMAFIRSIGEASKLLTPEQRNALTGFAPPASAMPAAGMAPPAAPMAPMKDM